MCSKILSENGFEVKVLEKESKIGGHIGENLQGFMAYELDGLSIDIPKENPIKEVCLWPSDNNISCFDFGDPILYFVVRGPEEYSFDNYLARKAFDSGADIATDSRVVDLISEDGFYKGVRTRDGEEYEARYIVAADGSRSFIRDKVGLDKFKPKGLGYGAKMEEVEIEDSTVHIIFNQNVIPSGYGYVNSYPGGDCATVGISYRRLYGKESAKKYFEKFLDQISPLVKNARKVSDFAGQIVCGEGDQKLSHRNILFTGESAGLQDPRFGFGMVFAIKSAKIAAEILEESEKQEDMEVLKKFESKCKNDLIAEINRRRKLSSNIIEKASDEEMDSIINFLREKEEFLDRFFHTGEDLEKIYGEGEEIF